MSALLGIDVGGTFTDVVVLRGGGQGPLVDKVPSTPSDPSLGVISALRRLRDVHGVDPGELELFAHGSTVATNALLEFNLPRTALIVTKGFRDVLEIGTQVRSSMFDLTQVKPRPIVPRELVFEVDERLDRVGGVARPMREEEITRVVGKIAQAGVVACAICLLFSFYNPEHERRLAAALQAVAPDVAVAISSDVAPEIKEYPRASTTAIAAALQPLVANYMRGMERGLRSERVTCPLFVMQSSGGVMSAEEAAHNAHRMVLSGPAAGVIAATRVAEASPYRNQITFDMGGTSTDICLIDDARPRIEHEALFDGRPLRVPQFDIHTIGSGGGSIARVDAAGLVRVGPMSSGAVPGPACYGRGGVEPTVTDAHLVLGRIDPLHFLGGEMLLNADAAKNAIAKHVADPLGLGLEEAALGVLDVADAVMARGVRVVSVNRGYDPRDFTLVAFGGAGPMHALTVGQLVDVGSVLVPLRPGAFSAVGLASSDLKYDFSQTVDRLIGDMDATAVEGLYQRLIQAAQPRLQACGGSDLRSRFVRLARFRYAWQDNAVEVVVGDESVDDAALAAAVRRFHELHEFEFGHSDPTEVVELVAVGLEAYGQLPRPTSSAVYATVEHWVPEPRGVRPVYFKTTGWIETPVYDRLALGAGAHFAGPAIIEEREATTVVTPGAAVRVDGALNLVLTEATEARA